MIKNQQEHNIVVSIPELSHLIRHLDLMYLKLIEKEKPQPMEQSQVEGQPLVEILGKPYIQTKSWYNPGQGIKQSTAVE
tara:strand:- start:464 stop:700 length:237 start_codon:yes stop_codon:yes gene_type:complete